MKVIILNWMHKVQVQGILKKLSHWWVIANLVFG